MNIPSHAHTVPTAATGGQTWIATDLSIALQEIADGERVRAAEIMRSLAGTIEQFGFDATQPADTFVVPATAVSDDEIMAGDFTALIRAIGYSEKAQALTIARRLADVLDPREWVATHVARIAGHSIPVRIETRKAIERSGGRVAEREGEQWHALNEDGDVIAFADPGEDESAAVWSPLHGEDAVEIVRIE